MGAHDDLLLVLLPRLGASVLGALRGKLTVEGRENADGTVTISHAAFDLLRLKDHAFDNVKEVSCGCSVLPCLPGSFCWGARLDSCTVYVLLAYCGVLECVTRAFSYRFPYVRSRLHCACILLACVGSFTPTFRHKSSPLSWHRDCAEHASVWPS